MSDIAEWLGDLGLDQYSDAFTENDVDLVLLPQITNDDPLRSIKRIDQGWDMKIS